MTGIYAIVDAAATSSPLELLDDVLRAGVRLVQYRAKAGVDRDLVRRMVARTRAADALLIVNDDLEAAVEVDGLHVGQEDLAALGARGARERLRGKLLGVSCATPREAREAEVLGADYVGAGPFAVTVSKLDAGVAIGEAGIRAVALATALPVAAIGGIECEDLEIVVRSGARMAAVISAIARGPDPEANARALVARWHELTA